MFAHSEELGTPSIEESLLHMKDWLAVRRVAVTPNLKSSLRREQAPRVGSLQGVLLLALFDATRGRRSGRPGRLRRRGHPTDGKLAGPYL